MYIVSTETIRGNTVNGIFAAETVQGRKLFKGGNYSRKYGNP